MNKILIFLENAGVAIILIAIVVITLLCVLWPVSGMFLVIGTNFPFWLYLVLFIPWLFLYEFVKTLKE